MAPSRFASTCSSAARSCASASSCMMRSASSSRWCGLTVHLDIEQPPTARAATIMRSLIGLEKDCERTGVLLDGLCVVGIEDDVMTDIAAQGDPLLQRHHQPPSDVHH